MALTARAGLLALLLVPLVALGLPSWTGVLLATLALAVLVAVDVALAPSVRGLALSRSGDTSVRLGKQATVTLLVENRGGRRLRGSLRDAWPPSAGAAGSASRSTSHLGSGAASTRCWNPPGAGDRLATSITVRALGPLGLGARQGTHEVPWRLRVLHPFGARRHLPSKLARLRELDGRSAVMLRGQGTEFDSLREYVIGDDVRSIDWRATARRADVVVRPGDRSATGTCCSCSTPVGSPPAGWATCRGSTPRWTPRCSSRRWRRGQETGSTCWRTTAGSAPASRACRAVRCSRRSWTRRRPWSRSWWRPTSPGWWPPRSRGCPAGRSSCSSRAWKRRRSRRACCRCCRCWCGGTPSWWPPSPTRGWRSSPPAAGDAADIYGAAAAAQARLERSRITELLTRRRVEVVDAPPDQLAPELADRYLALKAAGRL
jgi:uncharacterized protein (DUF58 family)